MLWKIFISNEPLLEEGKTIEFHFLGTKLYSSESDPIERTSGQYRTGTTFSNIRMTARASTEEMSLQWDVTHLCDFGHTRPSKIRSMREQAYKFSSCRQRSPWRSSYILDNPEIESIPHPLSSCVMRREFWLYARSNLMAYQYPTISFGNGSPDIEAIDSLTKETGEDNNTDDEPS